jgi:hypothetical protein
MIYMKISFMTLSKVDFLNDNYGRKSEMLGNF